MSLLPRLRQAAESQAINHGVRVVRSVLAANPFPNGFKTDDLFKLAVKEPIPENFTPVALEPTARQSVPPPHATHPVRSVKCVYSFSPVLFRFGLTCLFGWK